MFHSDRLLPCFQTETCQWQQTFQLIFASNQWWRKKVFWHHVQIFQCLLVPPPHSNLFSDKLFISSTREVLLKGKAQYSWPPCTKWFNQLLFILQILFTFFTKQATLMRRSTVLSLPPQLVFPASAFITTHFYPSLMFAGKAGSYPSGALPCL